MNDVQVHRYLIEIAHEILEHLAREIVNVLSEEFLVIEDQLHRVMKLRDISVVV